MTITLQRSTRQPTSITIPRDEGTAMSANPDSYHPLLQAFRRLSDQRQGIVPQLGGIKLLEWLKHHKIYPRSVVKVITLRS